METGPTLPITPTEKMDSWKSPTSVLGIIMAVLTAVSVLATVLAYRVSSDAVDVMREQIKASTRPYVIVDLEEKGAEIYFTVTNLGGSAAHNVKLKFDGVLHYFRDGESGPAEIQDRSISFLAPGKKIEELIYKPKENWGQTGIKHTVVVSYVDSSGTTYSEAITLIHDGDIQDLR